MVSGFLTEYFENLLCMKSVYELISVSDNGNGRYRMTYRDPSNKTNPGWAEGKLIVMHN